MHLLRPLTLLSSITREAHVHREPRGVDERLAPREHDYRQPPLSRSSSSSEASDISAGRTTVPSLTGNVIGDKTNQRQPWHPVLVEWVGALHHVSLLLGDRGALLDRRERQQGLR